MSLLASDASANNAGYYIDGRVVSVEFSEEEKLRPIAEREALAVSRLLKAVVVEGCDYYLLCDNTSVCGAFRNGRSSNEFIRQLIVEVTYLLYSKSSRLKVRWISTSAMAPLADNPSRRVFDRDPFGLTEKGVDRLFHLDRSISFRRSESELISLFGSPANNPLGIPYYSVDVDTSDPFCRKMDAFRALEERVGLGKRLAGGIFCFPPPILTSVLLDYMVRLGFERDTQVYLLIPSSQVLDCKNKLLGAGHVRLQSFCGKRNKTFLHRQPGKALSLITVSSFDLSEGWFQNARGKRQRLRAGFPV